MMASAPLTVQCDAGVFEVRLHRWNGDVDDEHVKRGDEHRQGEHGEDHARLTGSRHGVVTQREAKTSRRIRLPPPGAVGSGRPAHPGIWGQ
jgi:hypothetical protein